MYKRILLTTMFVIFLLVMMPFVSGVEQQINNKKMTMCSSFRKTLGDSEIPEFIWVLIKIILTIVLVLLCIINAILKVINLVKIIFLQIIIFILDQVTEWFFGYFFLKGFVSMLMFFRSIFHEILKRGPIQQWVLWIEWLIERIRDYIESNDENPIFLTVFLI